MCFNKKKFYHACPFKTLLMQSVNDGGAEAHLRV